MKVKVRDGEFNLEVFENRFYKDVVFLHGNLASNRWWHPTVEHWPIGAAESQNVKDSQAKDSHVKDAYGRESHLNKLDNSTEVKNEGRLILLEWRGSGQSKAPTSESQLAIAELAEDVIAVLESLKINSCHLVGHSTGGIIALLSAIKAPQLFDKLVLLDPVGPKGVQLTPEMLGAFELMRKDKSICSQVMASTIKNVDVQSDLFKGIVEDSFSTPELNWVGIPKAVAEVNIMSELPGLKQPVCVLHGEEDPILPIEDSKLLVKELPNGKFVPIAGAGHSLNVENPKEFVNLCWQFLR